MRSIRRMRSISKVSKFRRWSKASDGLGQESLRLHFSCEQICKETHEQNELMSKGGPDSTQASRLTRRTLARSHPRLIMGSTAKSHFYGFPQGILYVYVLSGSYRCFNVFCTSVYRKHIKKQLRIVLNNLNKRKQLDTEQAKYLKIGFWQSSCPKSMDFGLALRLIIDTSAKSHC